MNTPKKLQLIDLIVAVVLLLGALAALLQILELPERARMWPTLVIVALILFVGLHLINLLRGLFKARSTGSQQSDSPFRGG
ncbi:MAG: hypothetical protein P8X86_06470 [Desulfofustis sp.]|jgi:hypothetical protein